MTNLLVFTPAPIGEELVKLQGDCAHPPFMKHVMCLMQRVAAEKLLLQFQEHPQAWVRVDSILESSQNPSTKYFALQVSVCMPVTCVNTGNRWSMIPLSAACCPLGKGVCGPFLQFRPSCLNGSLAET